MSGEFVTSKLNAMCEHNFVPVDPDGDRFGILVEVCTECGLRRAVSERLGGNDPDAVYLRSGQIMGWDPGCTDFKKDDGID